MRCGSEIAFVMLRDPVGYRFKMSCKLDRGHEGDHKSEGITEIYTEDWEEGKYIDTRKEEYLGLRKFILLWENRDTAPGTIESKIQYWRTIGKEE